MFVVSTPEVRAQRFIGRRATGRRLSSQIDIRQITTHSNWGSPHSFSGFLGSSLMLATVALQKKVSSELALCASAVSAHKGSFRRNAVPPHMSPFFSLGKKTLWRISKSRNIVQKKCGSTSLCLPMKSRADAPQFTHLTAVENASERLFAILKARV